MELFIKRNLQPLVIWTLAFTVGYCFGGKTGTGIAATALLLIQVLT